MKNYNNRNNRSCDKDINYDHGLMKNERMRILNIKLDSIFESVSKDSVLLSWVHTEFRQTCLLTDWGTNILKSLDKHCLSNKKITVWQTFSVLAAKWTNTEYNTVYKCSKYPETAFIDEAINEIFPMSSTSTGSPKVPGCSDVFLFFFQVFQKRSCSLPFQLQKVYYLSSF